MAFKGLFRTAVASAAMLGALASHSPAACASASGRADGVCQELLSESASAVELLQKRAERAQPLTDSPAEGNASSLAAVAAKATTNVSVNTSAKAAVLSSANSSVKQDQLPDFIPDDVKGFIPDEVTDVFGSATVDAFVTGLSSTLSELDTEAQQFLDKVSQYRSALLKNVSSGGGRAIETLEDLVRANEEPITANFGVIVETLNTAAPAITTILGTVGLDKLAQTLKTAMDMVVGTAQTVLDDLHAVDDAVFALGNASQQEIDSRLASLNATAEAGLTAARDFEKQLVAALRSLIQSVGDELGVTVDGIAKDGQAAKEAADQLDSLVDKVVSLAHKLEQAVEGILFGTTEAATLAVETQTKSHKGGAEGLRLSLGALLAVLALGAQ